VLFEGSGSALPPIATRKRVLVAGSHQDPQLVTGYLNAYRILTSDLVVLTMAEEGANHEEIRDAIDVLSPGMPVVACRLRPRPVEPIAGRRVAFFTTAQPSAAELLSQHLSTEHEAEVVHVSTNLARRAELRRELEQVDADVYVVEIKAAAIDVVAEAAAERGVETVLCDNEVRSLDGWPDIDSQLLHLADAAMREKVVS
jgi:cyclic 2,3-diphosphoglycerate synthetase